MANLIDNDGKIITERAEGFGQPSVVRVSGGRIYVGHINDNGDLEIHYSDTDGSSWTLDDTFSSGSGNGDIDMFSFAVSDLDDVFVSYVFSTASDTYTIKIQKRDHTAGTWAEVLSEAGIVSDTTVLKPLLAWNRKPSLTTLHMFYMYKGVGAGSGTLGNKYSTNYGSSFSNGANKVITEGDFVYALDSIDTIASSGNVYITRRITDATTTARAMIYNETGTYQSDTYIHDGSNKNQYGISMAIDSMNNRWYLWFGQPFGGNYMLKVMKNEITESLSIYNGGSQTYMKGAGMIAIDGSDNIYAIYIKLADEKAYYRKYDVGTDTWESEVALTTGDGLRVGFEQHSLVGSDKLHFTYYTD